MTTGRLVTILVVVVLFVVIPIVLRITGKLGSAKTSDPGVRSAEPAATAGRLDTMEGLSEFLQGVLGPIADQVKRCDEASSRELPAERAKLVRVRDEALARLEGTRRRESLSPRLRRMLDLNAEEVRETVEKALQRSQQA